MQITDQELCNAVIDMHNSGLSVTVLVSQCIDSSWDTNLATECYNNMTKAGFTKLYKAASYYTFRYECMIAR